MIKTLIVDDEAHVREAIRSLIISNFEDDITIVAEADSVANGLNQINQFKPDLVLLDVHLTDGTGFELLTQLSEKDFDVIFITGFDNHAIKAIKVGALDYILKPVDDDEFIQAIEKVIENHSKDNNIEKLIEVSNEYFKGVEKKRVILKTLDAVYAVYEDDILFCKSEGNYTTFYTLQAGKIVVSKSMKKVEEILSEINFVRCHQSYIVNKKHVFKYNKRGYLMIQNDLQVPVSGRRKDYALNRIFE